MMGGMGGMMGGMGGMGGDMMGGIDGGEDPDHDGAWRAHALDADDIGKTFDVNQSVKKRLIDAKAPVEGAPLDMDNPMTGWECLIDYEARVIHVGLGDKEEEEEKTSAKAKVVDITDNDDDDDDGAKARAKKDRAKRLEELNKAMPMEPFVKKEGFLYTVDEQGVVPQGVADGIRSMRNEEKAMLTIQPALAFGADGDADKGVPGHATVEYLVHLHKMFEVVRIDGGKTVKKRLDKGHQYQRASKLDVVKTRWSGRVLPPSQDSGNGSNGNGGGAASGGAAGGVSFQEETEYEFTAGAKGVPHVFNHVVVGRMTQGEKAELTLHAPSEGEAVDGFGPGTNWPSVPVGNSIVLTVELVSWQSVEDVSEAKDGTCRKRTLVPGEGWEKPRKNYAVTIDLEARLVEDGTVATTKDIPPMASVEGLEVVVGSVGGSGRIAAISEQCGGGVDVAAALEVALVKMAKGEQSELRYHAPIGADLDAKPPMPLAITVRVVDWVIVETVPLTENEVVRRELVRAPKGASYERPTVFSTAMVRYTVREQAVEGEPAASGRILESTGEGEGAPPRSFVISEGGTAGVLPAIDCAVREMKKGERSAVTAPRTWAYSSPEYVPMSAEDAAAAVAAAAEGSGAVAPPTSLSEVGDVYVEIELVDFEKGKDIYSMTGDEKLVKQALYKNQGNKHYQAGLYDKAIKRYEESNRFEVSDKNLENDGIPLGPNRDSRLKETKQNMISCFLNIAMCHGKMGEPKKAEASCTQAVKLDETNVKARFRRGQLRLAAGNLDGARSDLFEAAKRDPQNRDIRREIETLKKQEQKLKQQQKGMFGGMFAT
jgi:hypothetical protein